MCASGTLHRRAWGASAYKCTECGAVSSRRPAVRVQGAGFFATVEPVGEDGGRIPDRHPDDVTIEVAVTGEDPKTIVIPGGSSVCPDHGSYRRWHGRCPHRHCGDDRPDADHETCTPGRYDGDVQMMSAGRPVDVDPCIADIVRALNNGALSTSNSCCGHGTQSGWIALSDGRTLLVFDDNDNWRELSEGARASDDDGG